MFPLVALVLAAAPPAPEADVPSAPFASRLSPHVRLAQYPRAQVEFERVTLRDAPVEGLTAFGASGLTGATGFFNLIGLFLSPARGLPMTEFSIHARVATSLLLMSVGPSMGDLLSHDPAGFLIGAGGRTALAALGYGTVMAMTGNPDGNPLLLVGGVLFVALAGLVWTGWNGADLVRAYFAPDRWVKRENARRQREAGRLPGPGPGAVPDNPGTFRM